LASACCNPRPDDVIVVSACAGTLKQTRVAAIAAMEMENEYDFFIRAIMTEPETTELNKLKPQRRKTVEIRKRKPGS
jgi:hypothetical protein